MTNITYINILERHTVSRTNECGVDYTHTNLTPAAHQRASVTSQPVEASLLSATGWHRDRLQGRPPETLEAYLL